MIILYRQLGVLVFSTLFQTKVPHYLNIVAMLLVIYFFTTTYAYNTVQFIQNFGYPVEIHYVTTEDGYILGLHRIPFGKNINNKNTTRPAILLTHGLSASAVDYVNLGPGVSLAYVLADSGLDVWLINHRGTPWSMRHKKLNYKTQAKEYWDWSFEDLSIYDNTAVVDYIINYTGQGRISLAGQSQGCTCCLVMLAKKPEYNEKIKFAGLLAPVAYHENYPIHSMYLSYKLIIPTLEILAKLFGMHELPTPSIQKICHHKPLQEICLFLANRMLGKIPSHHIDRASLPIILSNAPVGTSTKNLIHYGQNILTKRFAQYNYGRKKNLEIYGDETPPEYDLTNITVPISLYFAPNDGLQSIEDVKTLKKRLQNVVNFYIIPDKTFNHVDYIFARDAPELVYRQLLNDLDAFK